MVTRLSASVIVFVGTLLTTLGCNRATPDRGGQPEPTDAVGFNQRGKAWFAQREFDKALPDFTEAIRLNPYSAEYFCNRGIIWYQLGNQERAIADCTDAIRLDSHYASAFHCRGMAWGKKGDIDKAFADLNEAIRLEPKSADLFAARAYAWAMLGEHDNSIADCNSAIKCDPTYAVAFNYRGNAWNAKKEYDWAITDYTEAIRLDPNYPDPFGNRAWLRATCAESAFCDGPKALSDARRACELTHWKRSHLFAVLAAAYAEAGQFEEAVTWLKKALEDPGYAKLYSDRDQKVLLLYAAKKPFRDERK